MPEQQNGTSKNVHDLVTPFLGACVLVCLNIIYMLVHWSWMRGLYDTKTQTLIEEIVCRNVPMLLPFAHLAANWLRWKIIQILQLNKDRPETGKGANANMAGMGVMLLGNLLDRIADDIWRDLTAVVFLYLLIKTVFLSGHLFLAPLKLRQLFDGKPKNA